MFDTICTLPLRADAFAQAIHPTEPLISVGLSTGHVHSFRLPATNTSDSSSEDSSPAESGFGHIDTAWATRRHKGSCRTLGYGHDGTTLYSAGTDGIVKAADAGTGRVFAKLAVPTHSKSGDADAPALLHVLSPQCLLLATDSSALHIFDIRTNTNHFPSQRAQQTHRPHDDYVASLTPIPAGEHSTSGFPKKWVTTGGTTLALTDLRKGVIVRSEDQEEELLSSAFMSGLSNRGTNVGEKVAVGGATGVVTLWENGVFDDQDERIVVDRGDGGGESLDTIAVVPSGVGPGGKVVAVGMGDGNVKFVRIGANDVIGEVRHDEAEGVVGIGFDVGGRMVTAGGQNLKVWHESVEAQGEEEEEEMEEARNGKRPTDIDSDDSGSGTDSSTSDKEPRRRRKKRKRNKGKQQKSKARMNLAGLD